MIESREVGDMSSSIHSQKILKDAKVFIFFEDSFHSIGNTKPYNFIITEITLEKLLEMRMVR